VSCLLNCLSVYSHSREATSAKRKQANNQSLHTYLQASKYIMSKQAKKSSKVKTVAAVTVTETVTNTSQVSQSVQAILESLAKRFDAVRAVLNAKKASTVQFEREFKRLANAKLQQALVDKFEIDANFYEFVDNFNSRYLAVYALEKATDMLYCVASMRHNLDNYSRAIISNARALENSTLSYSDAAATICDKLKSSTDLSVRMIKASSTANAQRSSTRNALVALKCATYDVNNKTLRIEEQSEMFKALKAQCFANAA
jgi:hypothetical protein